MAFLRAVLGAECTVLIAALGAVTAWKILRAWLRSGGLAGIRKRSPRGPLEWQMVLTTVAVALLYLLQSLRAAGSGALPPVPRTALALLAASDSAWLASATRRLRRAGSDSN
jgi:hypothetical protein